MAPDLNSVPPSPRPLAPSSSSPRITSLPTSRRASQQMAPPAQPISALNVLPSNQSAVNNPGMPMASPGLSGVMTAASAPGDNTGVGTGPGPLRHPRPLTAADLHLQLEKEQEAVVNRLTRELSMLRAAQNASVVSNSSSTSAGFPDTGDHNANHMLSGPSHPAPSQRRHHRSSSSTSTRSIPTGTATTTNTASWTTAGVVGSVSSSVTPSSNAERNRMSAGRNEYMPQSLSRQNSVNSSRRSGASSPALIPSNHSSLQHPDYFASSYTQRPSLSMQREPSASRMLPGGSGIEIERQISGSSITSVQTTGRYEEAAYHRHELEAVKRENEALKRKIRELERTLRERRQSDASRTRSESVSTAASINNRDLIGAVARSRDTDKEDDGQEEAVRVGESARSGGLR